MNTEAYREKIKSIDHAIEWHAEEHKAWQRVKAEAETTQAEKPELRDGDYGTATREGHKLQWCWIGDSEFPFRTNYRETPRINYYSASELENISKVGNIFEDLKALEHPLKKFTMKEMSSAAEFSGTINKWNVYLSDHCHGTGINIGIEDIPELILNLRRLVHTAQQEADK